MIEPEKLAGFRLEAEMTLSMQSDHDWSQKYVNMRAKETLELLDEIARLQALVKDGVTFKLGDVVREVGAEDPTGTIIQIKEGEYFEQAYVVKLYKPFGITKTITYYHDEIELIRRGNG